MLVWGSHVKFEMPHQSVEILGAAGWEQRACRWHGKPQQGSKGPGLGGVEPRGAWLPLLCIQAARSRASHAVSLLYPMPACCVFLPIQRHPTPPPKPNQCLILLQLQT